MTLDNLFDLPDNEDEEPLDNYADPLFDLEVPEPDAGIARIKGCTSTPETQMRWAEIKKHRLGSVWQEGEHTYRRGPCGVTVFRF